MLQMVGEPSVGAVEKTRSGDTAVSFEGSKQSVAGPILAAVDFSPFSEQALVWAAQTARSFEAPLLALHVVHDSASSPGYYLRKNKQLKRIEEAAAEMMSDFLTRMGEEHPRLLGEVDHRLESGLPITRVLEVADDVDAQMIVMGSRGRNGLSRLLLGSVAERVAHLSPIPVTIVKNA